MSDGVVIHSKVRTATFDEMFRLRVEHCFGQIGMRPISITELCVTPAARRKGDPLIAAHYFPADPGNGTLQVIDWRQCTNRFQPRDSIHLMFTGDLAQGGKTEYWEVIVHFGQRSEVTLLSVITQFERLAEYDEVDRKRYDALERLARDMHARFEAGSTVVQDFDADDQVVTLIQFGAPSSP